jgi:hypothetical protein
LVKNDGTFNEIEEKEWKEKYCPSCDSYSSCDIRIHKTLYVPCGHRTNKNEKYCYVCHKLVEDLTHQLQYNIVRVGLGSCYDIWVCNQHWKDYKDGKDLIQLEKERSIRFMQFVNCGIDEYKEFIHIKR